MEKVIFGNQDEWYPFQKYPTNVLQNIMEYSQVLWKGALDSDINAFVANNKEFLDSGVGMELIYNVIGMARNSTIQR